MTNPVVNRESRGLVVFAVPQEHQRTFVEYSKFKLEGENPTDETGNSNSRPSSGVRDDIL